MKKIITLIILSVFCINAINAEITWDLSNDGTLTISGTGDMRDYMHYIQSTSTTYAPWYKQRTTIKKVIIENGVTSIGAEAFYKCSNLTSITIPNSVTIIGKTAFCDCSKLSSVTIPNSVKSIGNQAFRECTSLTTITIPNSVTSIETGAFYGCTCLTSITIGNSVTSIGDGAFQRCSALTSVTIGNSVTSIGDMAFSGCSGLTSITIPNSVTSIGKEAFFRCSNLTSVTIGNSVTNIGQYAFSSCTNLTSVTIGNSVTNIGQYAFYKCEKISKLTCKALIPPQKFSNSFEATLYKSCILYVPASSINEYTKRWASWKDNIRPLDVEPEKISLENASENLIVGARKTLVATITPDDAIDKTITWTSSNTGIATVSTEGVVLAKSVGTAIITAKTCNGFSAKCTVTVIQPVTTITLSAYNASLWVDETMKLTATVSPSTANNTAVKWVSSDNKVASVSPEGVLIAKGKGTCNITCKAVDGYGTKSVCRVTVKQPVTSISLNATRASLQIGETKDLDAIVKPTTANNTNVVWSSSNVNVATVSASGLVRATGKGTCTITCKAADGYGASSRCEVTVMYAINSIEFAYETLTMTCGTTKTLTPIVTPSNANVQFAWKSTNNSVVTVSSAGVLNALAPGSAKITCTATDGSNKVATITVNVGSLNISDSKPNIANGTYGVGGIAYTRPLEKNKYDVFCMPYDVNLSECTNYFDKVYVPTGIAIHKPNGTVLIPLKSVSFTETIPAGQPFVAYATTSGEVVLKNSSKVAIASISEPKATKLEVYDYSGNSVIYNADIEMTITGNYAKKSGLDNANCFVFSANGSMNKATTVNPYRLYITKNDERSKAKITDIQISFDGEEATGIEGIINGQKGDSKFYNLNGQRINKSNAMKGVYIKNGKKVVVK